MGSIAEEQAARITPPRRGEVLAITLDTTARPYDISSLALGGYTPDADTTKRAEVFLTVQAQTADLFIYFHSATASDLDRTAAIAAGGSVAFANTHGWLIPAGQTQTFTIDRSLDRFAVLQGSAGGIARMFASSVAAT